MTQLDALCAGIIVADHVCEPVDHVPAPGELVVTDRMDLLLGGCAANVAVGLTKLGRRAAVAGTVGRDQFGRFARESLQAAGVDVRHVSESDCDTSGTLIINTRGEDRRFIHSLGANRDFSGAELTADLVRSARVLYLGGYCLCDELTADNVAAAFRSAREAGVTTVLDVVLPRPGDYWPRLRPVLPWTDVFLPNNDEARLITGESEPVAQAEQFRAAGARTVVITCGSAGAVALSGPQEGSNSSLGQLGSAASRLRAGCYPVEFRDGTGSGDAFAAGFIHGLLSGGHLRQCVEYGSALGASCVRAAGATTGVFTADELSAFLAAHTLTVNET
jgi:sugar/nucleoside kinase (ribokinase family)